MFDEGCATLSIKAFRRHRPGFEGKPHFVPRASQGFFSPPNLLRKRPVPLGRRLCASRAKGEEKRAETSLASASWKVGIDIDLRPLSIWRLPLGDHGEIVFAVSLVRCHHAVKEPDDGFWNWGSAKERVRKSAEREKKVENNGQGDDLLARAHARILALCAHWWATQE